MIGLWTEVSTDLPRTIGLVPASLIATLMLPICIIASALIFSESIVDYTSSFFSLIWYTCLGE
jgi:ABC-type dipeptide/oligopeptide/nickel transport system permease component